MLKRESILSTVELSIATRLACWISLLLSILSFNSVAEVADFITFERSGSEVVNLTDEEKQWLEDHPVIRIGFDGHFPPYSYISDSNKLEGFAVDVFDLLSERTGIQFEVTPVSNWENLYARARNKQIDIVATMVDKTERRQWFQFTDPYIVKSLVIMTRDDDMRIGRREDIAGKRVALVRDYQYVKGLLQSYPTVEPYYVETMLDALHAVSVGKADAALTFLGGGHYLRTKHQLSNLEFAAIYDSENASESIAVRNDWPELAAILDKALKSIPESQMLEIHARWLPIDYLESLVTVELTPDEKQWISQHPNIRIGVDPEFAPFEYLDNGKYQGIASDYIRLLNKRLGLNMQLVEGLDWETVVDRAGSHEIDVLPAVGITQQRQQFLTFTKPYIDFHRVIITRDDAAFISGLGDIVDQTVAVQKSSSHEGYLRDNTSLTPLGFDTLQGSLLALSNGEVDAFIGNVASATYWIRRLNLTNLKVAGAVSEEKQSLHMAVRNDWPELRDILQKGLDSISDHQRRKISKKWILLDYQPSTNHQLVFTIIGVFSAVLVSVLLWNFTLNRKINQRAAEVRYYVHFDQLTDLPNRFLIQDRLSQLIYEARRSKTLLAVLSIDLDDFKKVNDSLSHSTGDLILKETAKRLSGMLSEGNTLGRSGGDEFVILLDHINDSAEAASFAQQLINLLRKPYSLSGREFTITASAGIAIYPDDGDNPGTLLKNADSAMHHGKTLGRDTYAFYTEELNRQVTRRLRLEEHMQTALENNEFYTLFQPKIDMKTNRIASFEALLRWHNAKLGLVSPAEFIPVSERNSLIEPIGLFVLKQALAQINLWRKQYDADLTMSVNLSPRQFQSSNLLADVKTIIENFEIPFHALELEITEGVLLSADRKAVATLNEFSELGIKLAMDDFGTGYSSMSYLRQYHFDRLKIDRGFIKGIATQRADRKLVSATIAMAHSLEMQVVAEGVETEEQRGILADLSCDFAQGFLYSKPVNSDEMSYWLKQNLTVKM